METNPSWGHAHEYLSRIAADERRIMRLEQIQARRFLDTYEFPIERAAHALDLPIPIVRRMVFLEIDPGCAQLKHAGCLGHTIDHHGRELIACQCECHLGVS